MKKTLTVSAFALLAASTVTLATVLGVVCRKVDAFDRKYGTDVLGGVPQPEARTKPAAPAAAPAAQPAEAKPDPLEIHGLSYEGEDEVHIKLSHCPDMDVIRNYVRVNPLPDGNMTFRCYNRYDHRCGGYVTVVEVEGAFAFRTNTTFSVLKGLPKAGADVADAGSVLQDDRTVVFRRDDITPCVNFTDKGRYLPPGGLNAVMLEAVNVTNVATGVRRVEPANLVQLLAREGGRYSNYWKYSREDSADAGELAGEAVTNLVPCVNVPNVTGKLPFFVRMKDGKPEKGIYLLTACIADRPVCEYAYYGSRIPNPLRCRVVCVSDLGLGVRRWGEDGLGVWVTSLSTGKPVSGAEVTVYSAARIKVMEGVTGENGWCSAVRKEKGEPFAVIVTAPGSSDMTFMALQETMCVDETFPDGARAGHLGPEESTAFLWTERGIYRHGEKIFLQAMFRTGSRKAPRPFPVELLFVSPKGEVRSRVNAMTDVRGIVTHEEFSVPDDQPGGEWTIKAVVPGGDAVFGETKVKIEEFAPPQIRVKVEDAAERGLAVFGFSVSAEHLFGGPAHGLVCEGAVVFEDVPFAPAGWKGWTFGNAALGLKPCFRRLKRGVRLDRSGGAFFEAPLFADSGLPKAAVRATAQGTVLEDGGRPATARRSVVKHYYPYYIGSDIPGWMKLSGTRRPSMRIACVTPEGKRLAETRKLSVTVERIDSHYSYRRDERGWATWHCERVRVKVADGIPVVSSPDADTVFELPLDKSGDYAVTVADPEKGVSFGRDFYLSDCGDDTVRAPLADPTEVTIVPDKAFYRAGERPRLSVRAPFTGTALLSVMRDRCRYVEVMALTNATSEITLRPVSEDDAPNLDVYLSVVQSVRPGANRFAVRAYGLATVSVRPAANELAVSVKGRVDIGKDGSGVSVAVDAPGAEEVTVTVVDEGINLLTGGETPDPVGYFARPRFSPTPLFDLYNRILPVLGHDALKAGGVKTGGGFGAEMLSRVSPVPTRRFKPLALWKARVPVKNGKASAEFRLPVFTGEIRVTAVACSGSAAGAGSVLLKVSPKLVMQPDAPRFVAPGDRFDVTLPVYNRSGADGKFSWKIVEKASGVSSAKDVFIAKDASTNIHVRLTAPDAPGEMRISYFTEGFGENHSSVISLPVRPAVAWRKTSGTERLKPGGKFTPQPGRFFWREHDSPLAGLASALEWLSDYPHGCLEQTVSRVFPLLAAGGILAGVDTSSKVPRAEAVSDGIGRVESMVRERDFVMWPDVDYAPWDSEVSLYAAHFLISADKAGVPVGRSVKDRVAGFLSRWAVSTNDTVSAYAVHTLALAGMPDRDRMFRLYDGRGKLSLLSRARLARAFVGIGDRVRAKTLLANADSPSGVKEASFLMLALLELDPSDARIPRLVKYLGENRDRARNCWGTTEENAHALIALGSYYRFNPPVKGERWISWSRLDLPRIDEVTAVTNGISVTRRFVFPEGDEADMNGLERGQMLISEITVVSPDDRTLGDLVIEDLFPGAFEPVRGSREKSGDWVLRSDARDDRMTVFSKRFDLAAGGSVTFRHPLRVVSSGTYTLPGVSVEAMYQPALNARTAPSRITVR